MVFGTVEPTGCADAVFSYTFLETIAAQQLHQVHLLSAFRKGKFIQHFVSELQKQKG